jgi:hypothetical protein
MSMLKTLTAVVTTQDILAPVEIAATPFLTRKVVRRLRALPLTSVIKLQGAPRDPGTKAAPAEDSTSWVDIETLSSSSATVAEITTYDYLRFNVTTADADGPDVLVDLEGVQ